MKNDGDLKKTSRKGSSVIKIIHLLFGGWIHALEDVKTAIIEPICESEKNVQLAMITMVSLVITWFIYVPIHELLHVGGCIWTGGTVTELIMGREYGADFLSKIFPFIKPESSIYAGRVTGFQPNGDAGYLMTDFLPFVLTIFPGVFFLLKSAEKKRIWMAGPGIVAGLAPFTNLTGDYFEMGSILSTRIVNFLGAGTPAKLIMDTTSSPQKSFFNLLRSDDIFRLFKEIAAAPANVYGLDSLAGTLSLLSVIIMGGLFAVILAGWTYTAGRKVALMTGLVLPEKKAG